MVKYFGLNYFNLFLNIFISFDFCINKVPIFDLSNNTKQLTMQTFSTLLMVSQFILFVIVLGNMCRLVCDYLITKIK